jgi:hypothetical protein
MATLEDINKLKYDATLRRRFESAMDKSATDILNEDPGTTNHANRIKWAKDVLYNLMDMVSAMMGVFMQNATLQSSGTAVTDNDILFIVSSAIDGFATNFYA